MDYPKKLKILLAEDDEKRRKRYARFLRNQGFIVEEAINGEQVINKLDSNSNEFGLLILDIFMPKDSNAKDDSNQGEVIAKFLENRGISIKIKFISQYPDRVNFNYLQGFENYDDHYFKPIPFGEFLNNVRKCIQ